MLNLHLRFKCTLIAIICSLGVFGQNIYTECLPDFNHEYFPYDVEDENLGISMFDTYSFVLRDNHELRKNNVNHVLTGKHTDFYKGGNKMHVAVYEDGRLLSFKNYYNNGKLERELKLKKEVPIYFKSFFPNQQLRESKEFEKGKLVENQKFYKNEKLKFSQTFNESGLLELQKEFNELEVVTKQIRLKEGATNSYEIEIRSEEDKVISYGDFRFSPDIQEYIKHGNFMKFNEDEELISEIIYKNGGVLKVLIEEDLRSSVPVEYLAFDKNNDGEISQKEMSFVVNDFFDDKNNVSLDGINELVNFFFEQD